MPYFKDRESLMHTIIGKRVLSKLNATEGPIRHLTLEGVRGAGE